MIRFFVAVGVVSLVVWGLGVLCVSAGLITALPGFFIHILLFVGLSTAILFAYLYRAPAASFVPLYLLTMVVKLLAYCGFAVFLILHDRENASANVAFFLVVYLAYTVLELGFLFPKINR